MENLVASGFGGVYRDKKILVTGNTGFKGAWLSIWLEMLGAKVFGISKDIPTEPSIFKAAHLEKTVRHFEADIRNLQSLKAKVKEIQPDFIFHLAAQPIVKASYDDPLDTITSNVVGTANVLESLRALTDKCVAIMITSDKCYDNVEWIWGYRENDALGGKDPYSASKGAAELMIKTYYHSYFKDSEIIILSPVRAGNVIGGGDWADSRLIPDIMRAWSKKESVEIRSPEATRPWQHVLEPLSGYLRAGQRLFENSSLNGEPYNFGPNANQNKTVLDILKALARFWGNENEEDLFTYKHNPDFHEAGLLKLNCDKALADLGWVPNLAFEETAKMTAEWYRAFYSAQDEDIRSLTEQQIGSYVKKAVEKNLVWIR